MNAAAAPATDAPLADVITDVAPDETPLLAEDLIEEVSIDGMCGVY